LTDRGFFPLRHLQREMIRALETSIDRSLIVSLSSDLTIGLWDLRTRTPFARIIGVGRRAEVALAPDGAQLIVGTARDEEITVWEVRAPRAPPALQAVQAGALALSTDGKQLATASRYEPTKVIDLDTGREIASVSGKSRFVWRQQL